MGETCLHLSAAGSVAGVLDAADPGMGAGSVAGVLDAADLGMGAGFTTIGSRSGSISYLIMICDAD